MEFIQIILIIVLIMLATLCFIFIDLKYQKQLNESIHRLLKGR